MLMLWRCRGQANDLDMEHSDVFSTREQPTGYFLFPPIYFYTSYVYISSMYSIQFRINGISTDSIELNLVEHCNLLINKAFLLSSTVNLRYYF